MKILIFCPYYPPHIGGLESHADEFNKYLSQKGVDIVVFTPHLPQNTPEIEIKYNNVKIIRFPAFEIIFNYPLPKFWSNKYQKLKNEIKKEKFDIVISRTRFFWTSLLALIYAKKHHIPWIHIEHGSDFVKSGGKFSVFVARIYDYTLGNIILKTADRIIANSQASAEFCKKIANKINCGVIYRGVEIEKILSAPANTEFKNKCKDQIIITFAGHLLNGKGVADLITALSQIKNENYFCFIVGSGPEENNLKNLAKKFNLENKIIFLGHRVHDKAMGILKFTDIFVNPSYTEGLPTTIIEAALCKNAIVATDVGGTREIITNEKSGFLIEPKNILQLKNNLEVLLHNSELRKQFGENAYNEVKSRFNWENSAEKYLEIIKDIKTNGSKNS